MRSAGLKWQRDARVSAIRTATSTHSASAASTLPQRCSSERTHLAQETPPVLGGVESGHCHRRLEATVPKDAICEALSPVRYAVGEGKTGKCYGFILDDGANHSLSDLRRALTPKGTLLPNAGGYSSGRWIGPMGSIIRAFVLSLFERQQGRPFLSLPNKEDLVALKELIEAGKVTPVIDRTYRLSETAEAIGYLGEGHARAKVVITV